MQNPFIKTYAQWLSRKLQTISEKGMIAITLDWRSLMPPRAENRWHGSQLQAV